LNGDKMVKSLRVVIATSAVLLVLGWTVPADSGQDQEDKPKNQEKQQRQEPAKQDQPQANRQQDQRHQQPQQEDRGQQDQRRQQGEQRDNSPNQRQQARGQQDQQRQQRQQQEQDNSARQRQQEARGQQDRQRQQRQQQEQDNSARQQQQQARGRQDQQRYQREQQDNGSGQERGSAQERRQQVAWQGDRAHSWQSEHRTWQQRGGYNGYRVPDDRFRGYYGQEHGFRIYSLPVMYVGGHRRFQYGGYWFGLVDPWPEYWSNDWYDSDDVYVDYYGDGYYLYNRRYPGDRIAISFYGN
jgi:hypothetical protein